jgi:transcriptional regulator with XRE-family HTH domain
MANPDPAMTRARALFQQSGLTLDELGQRMGYAGDTARKSAWQFLNKTADPRLSMLRKFAEAIGVSLDGLTGAFGTILIDPPWRFLNRTGKMAPEHKRSGHSRKQQV